MVDEIPESKGKIISDIKDIKIEPTLQDFFDQHEDIKDLYYSDYITSEQRDWLHGMYFHWQTLGYRVTVEHSP